MDADKLDSKVLKWLNAQGYPLEFEAAGVLSKAGLAPVLGLYMQPEKDVYREIDVVAWQHRTPRVDGVLFDIAGGMVVECKYSKVPWVVLCQDPKARHQVGDLSCYSMSAVASSALNYKFATTEHLEDLDSLDFGVAASHIGHSMVAALVSDSAHDVPYRTLKKIRDSARYYTTHIDEEMKSRFPAMEGRIVRWTYVLPCIVIDAPLYVTNYTIENNALDVEQAKWAKVRFMYAGLCDIYVVSREAFAEFSALACASIGRYLDFAVQVAPEYHAIRSQGDPPA